MDRRHRWLGVLMLAAVLTATAVAGSAADTVETQPIRKNDTQNAPDSGPLTDWLRLAGALAVVVALVFAARYLLRRAAAPAGLGRADGPVTVIARVGVSMRQQLLLVRLGGRLLLIGAGPETMRTLCDVRDPQEVSELLAAVGSKDRGRHPHASGTDLPAARGKADDPSAGEAGP